MRVSSVAKSINPFLVPIVAQCLFIYLIFVVFFIAPSINKLKKESSLFKIILNSFEEIINTNYGMMNNFESLRTETDKLLKNDIFVINSSIDEYLNFEDYLSSLLKKYNDVLKNNEFWATLWSVHYPNNQDEYKNDNFLKVAIDDFSTSLKKCVNQYYLGQINLAYKELEVGLNSKIKFNSSVLYKQGIRSFKEEELTVYRFRSINENDDFVYQRNDLFHIPFHLRHKIPTQRFSIPGYPALYCGDSAFVCWKELNEPDLNKIYASRFSNSKTLNLIELLSLSELKSRLSTLSDNEYSSELIRYLLIFPLIISCSVKTKNNYSIFKSEYIVPQLFMQYVLANQEKIDGIKYFSTKIDEKRLENILFNNFVFPAKTNSKEGYCKNLILKFKLTEPIFWAYEKINNSNVTYFGADPDKNKSIELIKGRKIPYDYTEFKSLENTLNYECMVLENLKQS